MANAEQIRNAAIIYSVGRSMGMSNRDIQIGLIAAMVESNLVNVNYGDRDSLGLFQQRPSQGWGTPQQVMDPRYAARKFFSVLKGVRNRDGMSMGQAAQAVQRSAFPGRYDERVGEMRRIWPQIVSAGGGQVQDVDGQPYKGFTEDVTNVEYQPTLETDYMTATPSVEAMLGAWDDSPTPLPEPIPQIGIGTNEILTQQRQEHGPFTPGVDGWRKGIVETAQQYEGVPYVWGGTSPSGFDCSGFIQYVYSQMGINLPRISYQQANAGKRIGLGGLRPGDLVAWDNSSRNNGADHIAIYIGNGQIIEAPRPGLSVRVRSLGKSEGAWGVRIRG